MIVKHYTYFSERTLRVDLDFEEAKLVCKKYAMEVPSDNLGQSHRDIEAPLSSKVPFQSEVRTMTAEAGEVMDLFTVEHSPNDSDDHE